MDLHMTTADRLRLVADTIESHPEKWNQWNFFPDDFQVDGDPYIDSPAGAEGCVPLELVGTGLEGCGTGCCIAGWACLLSPADEVRLYEDVVAVGARQLGLDAELANKVFVAWDEIGLDARDPHGFASVLRHLADKPEPRTMADLP